MSAVLQTPPHSQCSELCCTDNPPVGAFVCACAHSRDFVHSEGCAFVCRCVCVFKKVCEAGRLCGSSVGVCMTGRVSAAAQPQSSLNPLSCVVHSCHISPIVSTDKEAQLKLNAS